MTVLYQETFCQARWKAKLSRAICGSALTAAH